MISRDQVEKASESLLEPAKQELAAKQEKVARRQAVKWSIFDALVPAAIGAGIAVLFLSDPDNSPGIAFLFGAVFGGLLGAAVQKRA